MTTSCTMPLMRSPRMPATATLAAFLAALSGACGGLNTPDGYAPPTLHEVQGQVTGQLDDNVAGELRAALTWSVYSDELIACVDAVEVNGPINWLDDSDFRVIEDLQRCLNFSERGRDETASVPLEPSFPARFTIPVSLLPEPAVLSGSEGSRLGLAGVLIYTDDNDSGVFEETPLGAASFIDTVRGSSFPVSDDAEYVSYLIYREGALSPLWKLFVALYGCPEPQPGFQTLTVEISGSTGDALCVLDDRPLDVALQPGIETAGCAEDPVRDAYTRPTEEGLPAGSAMFCDEYADLLVTLDTDSVCPSFRRYALVGCSDLSSEQACRQTFWDLTNTPPGPPGWWPCSFGNTDSPRFTLSDLRQATDALDARLFSLTFRGGLQQFEIGAVNVSLVIGGAEVPLAATLVDHDGNGVFNFGDTLTIGERSNDLTTQTPPGNYAVRVRIGDIDVEVLGAYAPVPIPEVTPIDVTASDAPAEITDGIDDLAIVTYAGEGVGHPFSALSVHVLVGGELPLSFSAAGGGVIAHNDVDGDGLFEPGDALLFREESAEPFSSISREVLQNFGVFLYVTVMVDVGENAPQSLANTTVEVQ